MGRKTIGCKLLVFAILTAAITGTFTIILAVTPRPSWGWGLKTHLWISQQVLNDAQDGKISIGDKEYLLAPEVTNALRNYPEYYRGGNLGPDVWPDPIVGQTTTHPGVEGGWQTDQWLKHLLESASSPQELAAAYGFLGHASGDIFGHSYVNMYAGDIFVLTDKERDVERRHFVLEKYIEAHTPPLLDGGGIEVPVNTSTFQVPSAFLTSQLIFNETVSRQYLKASTGLHLSAMHTVRGLVNGVSVNADSLISGITTVLADALKRVTDLQIDLAVGKGTLELAQIALNAEKVALQVKEAIYNEAIKRLEDAQTIIRDNPGLIDAQWRIHEVQIKIAADLVKPLADAAVEINNLQAELDSQTTRVSAEVAKLACYTLVWPPAVRECKDKVDELRNFVQRLKDDLTARQQRKRMLESAREAAIKAAEDAKTLASKLREAFEKAQADIASGVIQAQIDSAKFQLEVERKAVTQAQEAVDFAKSKVDEIARRLKDANTIAAEVKSFVDRYNLLSLFLKNWKEGIDKAGEEWIKASFMAGADILASKGNPLEHYIQWYACYQSVFAGVPHQIPGAVCQAKVLIDELLTQLDDAIAKLPEPLRWMLDPLGEMRRRIMEQLKPELYKAGATIFAFITQDPVTADFLLLLAQPQNATVTKLNEVFGSDQSGKGLLRFDSVSQLINADIGLATQDQAFLNPSHFSALKHSVTLAKLSLLGPTELNKLFIDYGGKLPTKYGSEGLYEPTNLRFSLLLQAVRSIDGNHQWQEFGLPYPRRDGTVDSGYPLQRAYGYSFIKNNSNGFRLWVDSSARENVFLKLFAGGILGSLGSRGELQYPQYAFPACEKNQYPSTVGQSGNIQYSDYQCLELMNPQRWWWWMKENIFGWPMRIFQGR